MFRHLGGNGCFGPLFNSQSNETRYKSPWTHGAVVEHRSARDFMTAERLRLLRTGGASRLASRLVTVLLSSFHVFRHPKLVPWTKNSRDG